MKLPCVQAGRDYESNATTFGHNPILNKVAVVNSQMMVLAGNPNSAAVTVVGESGVDQADDAFNLL